VSTVEHGRNEVGAEVLLAISREFGKSLECFHAGGDKGQYIYISPQKKVIIVRNGFEFGLPSSQWLRLFYQLADGSFML